MRKMKLLVVCIIALNVCMPVKAQSPADTLSLINEFDKLMSFFIQTNVHFESISKVYSDLASVNHDSSTTTIVYYKAGNDIYYSNGTQEMALQDSLLYRINNSTKQIWVSKVNVGSKSNFNITPLSNISTVEKFRSQYSINKEVVNKNTSQFYLRNKNADNLSSFTEFIIEYNPLKNTPIKYVVLAVIKEEISPEYLQQLELDRAFDKSLIRHEADKIFLYQRQRMEMIFTKIDSTIETKNWMPSIKDYVYYDAKQMLFSGKAKYLGYIINKTF